MHFIYTRILKPFFFRHDPETVHEGFMNIGAFLGRFILTKKITGWLFDYRHAALEQELFGKTFRNPLGLSAGFDYNIQLSRMIGDVGFAFSSGGTVTQNPYAGNPKPRLARLPQSHSILVNKGFKGAGIKKVLGKNVFTKYNSAHIGISIGATNSPQTCSPEAQVQDIIESFHYLKEHAYANKFSYIEVNISCPNVAGSGVLADPEILDSLLAQVRTLFPKKTLFVKFQLQMEWKKVKKLVQIMIKHKVDAIIIANLLKQRDEQYFSEPQELQNIKEKALHGNFSGLPTQQLSNELIGKVYQEFGGKIKIIGVGGIFSAQDAYEKIKHGASLVQMITGMIFEGPQVVGQINKGLVKLLKKDGFQNITEAVGSYYRK